MDNWTNLVTILFLVTVYIQARVNAATSTDRKVCVGTNSAISTGRDSLMRYKDLKTRYTNCTYLDGNLEITWLEGDYDLSFLSSIEEVTGYVLVVVTTSQKLPLTSLRIIRGKELYQAHTNKTYSLYVARNFVADGDSGGMTQLQLTSLHEIMRGEVFISDNKRLCHVDSINWSDITDGPKTVQSTDPTRCSPCDAACNGNGCWGTGANMCQKLTKTICSPQCANRCFGSRPSECCNSECAGGCTGPTISDCWACKNFENDGKCETYCPKPFVYNQDTFKNEPNPDAKYAYGGLCVDECPDHMVAETDSCVTTCGPGRIAEDGKCYDCDGPCPLQCDGIAEGSWLEASNIQSFEKCTIVQGNLKILKSTFQDLHPSDLSVFQDVREITGYLMVQGTPPELTDLSMFKNLHVIDGRNLHRGASIFVTHTQILKLGLESLEHIRKGNVIIFANPEICYSATLNWTTLFIGKDQKMHNMQNKNSTICEQEGYICDEQCQNGCWDSGPDTCRECKNYVFQGTCIESCSTDLRLYDRGNQTCEECHEECQNTCSGPGNEHCDACRHVKDGPYCVAECPESKYPDIHNICQPCHEYCTGGCTGPINNVGTGACNTCEIAIGKPTRRNITISHCMSQDSDCPSHTYMTFWDKKWGYYMMNKRVCLPCHEECDSCRTYGVSSFACNCKNYEENGICVPRCSHGFYSDEGIKSCERCSDQCTDCYGSSNYECSKCTNYKIYYNGTMFNCTDECPYYLPFKVIDKENGDKLCVAVDPQPIYFQPKVIGPVVAVVAVAVVIAIILVTLFCMRRAKSLERQASIKARLEGLQEEQPLTPTDAVPDMSIMRLVKESELKMGQMIGSGAFGTVYKGVWIPESENVKIPIAIKVLKDSNNTNQNTELLEEARVMASVIHPCCIRILGVCMTAQLMLITQLMPLGCLLDYVSNNKKNIGSKALLNWCTQIAQGMAYLEKQGIVHRDLAARNVLVQSPTKVKITDFGLAKLLDYNVEEFHESGGKMPIKWLALECIQERLYTHKSDVWSFGVTVWELFTFGQKPYDNTRAWDIPDLLSKGERLPQPSICTIDAYMVLVKCWMLDAGSRPTFKELTDQFARMARDPGRYLVIAGDALLRLPSFNKDTRELLRNMSIMSDGPEEVMLADDYLRPAELTPPLSPLDMVVETDEFPGYENHPSPTHQNNNFKPYKSPQSSFDEPDGARPCSPSTPIKGRKPTSIVSQDSFKGRYTSDPCSPKHALPSPTELNKDGIEMNNMNRLPPPPPTPFSKVGPPPPVPHFNQSPYSDEDNYLQPKQYNPDVYQNVQDGGSPPEDYMSMDKPAVDNPEYFNTPSAQYGNSRDAAKPLLNNRFFSDYKNV